MVSPQTKGSVERAQAERLLNAMGFYPIPAVTSQEPPEPDVRFILAERTVVGMEVTAVHPVDSLRALAQAPLPQALRVLEGEREDILRLAKTQWTQAALPPIALQVHWRSAPIDDGPQNSILLPKANRTDYAARLTTVLRRATANGCEDVTVHASNLRTSSLPPGIDSLYVSRTPQGFDRWASVMIGWGTYMRPDWVQAAADRKHRKPAKYSMRYDQIWLLLVVGTFRPSTWGHPDASVLDHCFQTPFDRLFLLQDLLGVHHELRVSGCTPAA